jgi:hypothetical protein
MKTTKNLSLILTLIASVIFFSASVFAQEDPVKNKEQNQVKTQTQSQDQNQVHGSGFVDMNSDGINDNSVDSDGDGVSNGQDPDYVKPKMVVRKIRMEKETMAMVKCGGQMMEPVMLSVGPKTELATVQVLEMETVMEQVPKRRKKIIKS